MWFFNVLWIYLIKQYANPSHTGISTWFSLYIIIQQQQKKKKKKKINK